MYTKLSVQEWHSFMYLDIKFGGHPVQNDYKVTMYTQPFVNVYSVTCVVFLNKVKYIYNGHA